MKKQQLRRVGLLTVLVGGAVISVSTAQANSVTTIDLTTLNATGSDGQGATYSQDSIQPTGTGVIDPFLTIQAKKTEQGYNTDATTGNLLDDLRSPSQWVRSVKIADVANVNGFAVFLLDINEQASAGKSLLSLNKVELFSTSDPNMTGYGGNTPAPDPTFGASTDNFYEADGTTKKATQLYNLDGAGDKTVKLDYSLGHGSGSGDMYAYIPYSVLGGAKSGEDYLVLYASFGNPDQSGAGFEEWSVVLKEGAVPGPGLPLPSAAAGGALVLGAMGFGRRSRRRS